MLKKFKPISLILLAATLSSGEFGYASDATPAIPLAGALQQTGKLTGIVSDSFGPVAGASVVVKGSTNGNITDMDGQFMLEGVKNGDIIQISFIGFSTQEIKKLF